MSNLYDRVPGDTLLPPELNYVELEPENPPLKYTQLQPEEDSVTVPRQLYDRALPEVHNQDEQEQAQLMIPAPVMQVSSPFLQAQPIPRPAAVVLPQQQRTSFAAAPQQRTSFNVPLDQTSEQWNMPQGNVLSSPVSPPLSPRAINPAERQSMSGIAAFNDQGVPARFKDGLFDLTRFGWFHGMVLSKHANEMLRGRPPGSFLVRCSSKGDGNFVLVHVPVKPKPGSAPGEPAHVLISSVSGPAGTGYVVQGNSMIWNSIPQIVNAWASKKHLLHVVDSRNCEHADQELRFWQMKAMDEE
jgi:hypothetical protein